MPAKNPPRTNLCDDINKLIVPSGGKNNNTLAPRATRQSIGVQSGSGRDSVAGSSSSADVSGTFTTTDGLFTIIFE